MKEKYYWLIIMVLLLAVEFFAVRYWRDETIMQLSQTIAQQNQILQQTNAMLNQVEWSEAGRNAWNRLGYAIQPKVDEQNNKK